MMEALATYALGFGVAGAVALAVLVLVVSVAAHFIATPGKEVSILWGLARYTKRPPKARTKPVRPIEIMHEQLRFLWRTQVPPSAWIDDDLSHLDDDGIDAFLSGPYHMPCRADLNYFDADDRTYRIRRNCDVCKASTLPEAFRRDETVALKWLVLEEVQRRVHAGAKLRSPFKI